MLSDILQLFVVLSLLLFCIRWIIPAMIKIDGKSLVQDQSYLPKVSMIMSCFNEGEDVYNTLISLSQVDYPDELLEIIAIDDCSTDDSFAWMQKAARDCPKIKAIKNEVNKGKHRNVLRGVEISTGEVIVCTDSDLIYDSQVIKQLVSCFSNSRIGAVGGVVGIKNPDVNVMTRWQTMIYHYGFNLWKMPEVNLKTVFCISGCLFAIKREVFDIIKPKIESRNWFGLEIKGGEDRYMTHQVLMAGYDTIVNTNAKCYTTAPLTLRQLFMQQLRWKRSGLMMFFWAAARPLEHTKRFSAASLCLLLLPPTLSLTVLSVYVCSLAMGDVSLLMLGKFMFTTMVFACVAFMSSLLLRNEKQSISGLMFLPALMIWYVVIDQFFLPLLALLTLDEKGWSSR